jgi:hypothetical protein
MRISLYTTGSQLGVILLTRECMAMSGDIFAGHNARGASSMKIYSQDAAEMHRTNK